MHKYIITGVQGCGKGTQSRLLQEHLDLVHISVGDMFRWHIANHTKLAARIKRIMNDGHLVGDEIVEEMVSGRLRWHDWNYGFILDGFPRNEAQAGFFLETYDIDAVIHIHLPDEIVRARVLSRRLCSQCGVDYNLLFDTSRDPGVCDVCTGALVRREDDTEEALADRLAAYHQSARPVLELFRRKELVIEVDGTAKREAVQSQIRQKLGV